jgi:hypothetical protein
VGERDHISENCRHAAAKIAVVIPYYQDEPGILRGRKFGSLAPDEFFLT